MITVSEVLYKILEKEAIRTVFQPIISLYDGSTYAYEALTRLKYQVPEIDTQSIFECARTEKCLWELEMLCRNTALKAAALKPSGAKLFINIDTQTIQDPKMESGFTLQKLLENGLNPRDIILELTENGAVKSIDSFVACIKHYQDQNFKIAIDDFGSGYSGMNRVFAFSPSYLKIDMGMVRDINKHAKNRSAIGAIVKYCREAKIITIAEGIETEAELTTLVSMGVDYGQGFFLGIPSESFSDTPPELKAMIIQARKKDQECSEINLFGSIKALASDKCTADFSEKAVHIYERIKENEDFSEVVLLDEERNVKGMITRTELLQKLGGQYGYSLFSSHSIDKVAGNDYLSVDWETPVDAVAGLATKRSQSKIYDSIVVTREEKYYGVVSVIDLLNAAINIRVKRASDSNPLTGLPGNWAIQGLILENIEAGIPFSLIYLDLDNFKAYNDAYGFSNGDLMIKAVAEAMKESCGEEDFYGHIGGDDFVIISQKENVIPMCKKIIELFRKLYRPLYSHEDMERGYIISKNRSGFTKNFPLATISISVVHNRAGEYYSKEQLPILSEHVAKTKKRSKKKQGNVIAIAVGDDFEYVVI